MANNQFYLVIEKLVVMPQGAWNKLIIFFEGIPAVPATYDSLGVQLTDPVDGTPPLITNFAPNSSAVWARHNLNTPFDKVIYEAVWADGDISLLAIRRLLANAANVALATITTNVVMKRYAVKQSAYVTFNWNGIPMFNVALFGRANDTQAIDRVLDSLPEAKAYLSANPAEWDG